MNLKTPNYFLFKPLASVLIVLCWATQQSTCVVLNSDGGYSDGGYSIVVAVDAFTSEPEVPALETLIGKIKEDFSELSSWLQSSTGKFYLKNVDILLQSHSNLVHTDDTATHESYKTADVQISEKVTQLRAYNPNECGLPGSRITVPLSLFTDEETNSIGGKALLPHFARFRWGVFEEAGSKTDPGMYPRFYRTASDMSSWKLTACSDVPLVGIFNASETEVCNLEDLTSFPPNSCQFFPGPAEVQTAKSSLMNYHWLDNMKEFCDEATHNKMAPNIQNIMCQYRSVMEVIRDTADWKLVTESPENVTPSFRVLGTSHKPRLYLLLDRGRTTAPQWIIKSIATEIGAMLQTLNDPTIISAIGAFPSTSPENALDEFFSWSLLSDIQDSAPAEIEKNLGQGIQGQSGFSEALLEISRILQANENPQGTIVAILKVGPVSSFENAAYEYDIAASLATSLVHVHAIEIQGNSLIPGINLENIVNFVGGYHVSLKPSSSSSEDIQRFVESIVQQFQDTNITSKNIAVIHKGTVNESQEFQLGENMRRIQFFLTTSGEPPQSLSINLNGVALTVTQSIEWNDGTIKGSRMVFQATAENEEIAIPLNALISYDCVDLCDMYAVITGEPFDNGDDNELFSLEISTSSPDNHFDWSISPGPLETANKPCYIHAKMPYNSDNEVQVQAIVCKMNEPTTTCQTIDMVDDGMGDPDILKNDDIYSCALIPPSDGSYRLQIRYQTLKSREDRLVAARTFDYESLLVFKAVENFQPLVQRIVDLTVTQKTDTDVILSWTAPTVYAGKEELLPESYDLRFAYAGNFSLLLTDFENCDKVLVALEPPSQPGRVESVTIPNESSDEMYYALRASYATTDISVQSPTSNLVTSAFAAVEQTTEPPTTETTTEGTTTETTTEEATTETTTEEATTETTTEEATTETTTEETATETTTEETTTETTTEEATTETTTEEATTETTTEETTTETTTEETTTETTTEETTTETTTEETTTETTTEETTTEETTTANTTTSTTERTSTITYTEAMSTTPETVRFFKKPIGYITAAVGGTLVVVGIGGAVGYLYWKRKRLMDLGRLKRV